MIFALYDYLQYAFRRGRFGDNQRSGMGMGHYGSLSQELLSDMRKGDIILTQRLDSKFSWAMMYFTSSAIDHAAIYLGDGKIAHMTLGGFKEHKLGVLTKNSRTLPLRFAPNGGEDPFDFGDGYSRLEPRRRMPSHRLPPKAQLIWAGIRINLGLHSDRFRWKFLADILVIGMVLDLMTVWATGFPVFCSIAASACLFASASALVLSVRQKFGAKLKPLSHPDLAFRAFSENGGVMLSNLGPLVCFRPIGILPLDTFRALGGESPEDGSQDELEPIRQYIRDVVKYWDLADATSYSKYQNRD